MRAHKETTKHHENKIKRAWVHNTFCSLFKKEFLFLLQTYVYASVNVVQL